MRRSVVFSFFKLICTKDQFQKIICSFKNNIVNKRYATLKDVGRPSVIIFIVIKKQAVVRHNFGMRDKNEFAQVERLTIYYSFLLLFDKKIKYTYGIQFI